MKLLVTLLLACSSFAAGAVINQRDVFLPKDASDMTSGKCAPVAAIFARGTFDEGNIGVWVGPQFLNPLKAKGAAIQGVDPAAYPASLDGYLKDGGPAAAAKSMAETVNQYVKKCGPETAIIISGWSQGALVAHKSISYLSPAAKSSLAGFVTFGDPAKRFGLTGPPSSVPSKSYCVSGAPYDPLCSDIHIPEVSGVSDAIKQIEEPFKKLPTVAHGAQQAKSAAVLVTSFPKQLWAAKMSFAKDVLTGDIGKLMLTPQHFTYGNAGQAEDAAKWVLSTAGVKKALAGGSGKGEKAATSDKKTASASTNIKGAAPAPAKGAAPTKSKLRRSLPSSLEIRDAYKSYALVRAFDAKLDLFERSLNSLNHERRNAVGRELRKTVLLAAERAVKRDGQLFV